MKLISFCQMPAHLLALWFNGLVIPNFKGIEFDLYCDCLPHGLAYWLKSQFKIGLDFFGRQIYLNVDQFVS